MIADITDSLAVTAAKKALRKGRLISAHDAERVMLALGQDATERTRFVLLATATFLTRIRSGKRLNSDQLTALRLIDGTAAAEYEAQHAARSTARTGAERVAAMVARRSDIGELPEVLDVARREACRFDLERFGVTYCGALLRHAPSARMRPFIEKMQHAILVGGQIHVRWPRGKGKSTWIKIAILWATVYGHRRFAVAFAANRKNATQILNDIWCVLETSAAMLDDFPEVAYPVRCLNGITQRCVTQSYKGARTNIGRTSDMIKLPTVEGSVASGALIVCRGVEAGTRGLVNMDQRPDFLFFDDIQTRKSSCSGSKTDWLEDFVTADAMCMAGHENRIAALMASTPIKPNDLSERFANVDLHPEWITFTTPLIIKWPSNMDLVDEFGRLYYRDLANRDIDLSASKEFYMGIREELEADSELLDPLDGDAKTEVSALHHALILYYKIGREGFMAEYQMQTTRAEEVFALDHGTVASALNHYPRCVVPDECNALVAFCDINAVADAGMRWGVLALGPRRVAAVVAYGRYPETGRLFPERSTLTQQRAAIANGVLAVAQRIAALPLRRANGLRVAPKVLCFDIGWETKTVARAIKTVRAPFPLIAAKGSNWRTYKPYKPGGEARDNVLGVGDHCYLAKSENGEFLSVHADYWREEAQRAFLAPPLQHGSVSLFGDDKTEHYEFAKEVCAEHLADKGTLQNGTESWVWNRTGANHWGDVLSGLFAVASWYRLYDATETVVDRELRSHADQQARPVLRNPARRVPAVNGQQMRQPRFRIAR